MRWFEEGSFFGRRSVQPLTRIKRHIGGGGLTFVKRELACCPKIR
jgi:hypothetical protein